MSYRHLQNMPIYFPSGKYKVSVRSFIAHNTSCPMTLFSGAPIKRMTGEDDRNTQTFFSLELDNNVYQPFH